MTDVLNRAYGGVSGALAAARALPGIAYADPAVFEAEVDKVLRAGWTAVARESDLAAAGDYLAADLHGAPVVAVRDARGEVRVLSGVCRHRGMPLLPDDARGNGPALTCPYHLWRYRLDGGLAAAPAMERSEAFDRRECDLPQVASERWGGWVFANADGRAPPLAPRLAGLAARLAPIDPASLVTAGTIDLHSPWNWKLMVENFLESYHHIGPHVGSLQQTNPGLGTYESEGSDAYTVLENPPADAAQGPFVVAAVFPLTLMFFVEGGARLGVWYQLDHLGHEAFRLRIHLLAPPEFAAVPEMVAHYREQVLAVHNEDIPACEGTWRGVRSPFYEPGPLSHLEAPLWRFHTHLARRLAA